MDNENVLELMGDHLIDLKKTAEECDEKMLAPITAAMISTAGFIVELNKNLRQDE